MKHLIYILGLAGLLAFIYLPQTLKVEVSCIEQEYLDSINVKIDSIIYVSQEDP